MLYGRIHGVFQLPGIAIRSMSARSAVGGFAPQEISLPPGYAGTLTSRNGDNAGFATLDDEDHDFQSGDKIDVYWPDGVRYGMNVGSIDGAEVNLQSGTGDPLPDVGTSVVVTKQVVIDVDFHSDYLILLAAMATQRAHIEFHDGDTTSVLGRELLPDAAWWYVYEETDDPFGESQVEEIRVSNGSPTDAATLKIGGLYDSTP